MKPREHTRSITARFLRCIAVWRRSHRFSHRNKVLFGESGLKGYTGRTQ